MNDRFLSMSQLANFTGVDRRTVKDRIAGLNVHSGAGNAHLYDSREALPLILLPTSQTTDEKLLAAERLKYEAARAERMQLQVARIRGEQVDIEAVGTLVDQQYAYVHAGFVTLGNRLADELRNIDERHKIKRILDDEVNTILTAMSADQIVEQSKRDSDEKD
jgi:hypothetical protein